MSTLSASPATSSPILSSPISVLRKQKMSVTQTYYLAHKARAKLSHEAAMPDHNLRLLVGHANLLDSLMLELADAEREQESWFNQSVRSASHSDKKEDRHIQWADTIAEEEEDDDDDEEDYEEYESSSSDEEDDSDLSDEDVEMVDAVPLQRVASHNSTTIIHLQKAPASPKMEVVEIDMEDDFEGDDFEDYAELTLTRSPSHHSITSSSPPPELEHDSDDLSEDEAMPPSPPSTMLPTFEEKQKESDAIAHATDFYDETIHHYMPAARNPARLVSAISVY